MMAPNAIDSGKAISQVAGEHPDKTENALIAVNTKGIAAIAQKRSCNFMLKRIQP